MKSHLPIRRSFQSAGIRGTCLYPPCTRRVPMTNAKSRSGLGERRGLGSPCFWHPCAVTAAGNPTPDPAVAGSGLNLPNCHFGHYRLQCTDARWPLCPPRSRTLQPAWKTPRPGPWSCGRRPIPRPWAVVREVMVAPGPRFLSPKAAWTAMRPRPSPTHDDAGGIATLTSRSVWLAAMVHENPDGKRLRVGDQCFNATVGKAQLQDQHLPRGQHRLDISRADRHHTFAVAAGLPMAACSRIDDLSIETLLFLCNLPIPNLPWPATGRGINPLSTIQPSGAWSRLLNKVRRNRNSSTRFAEPSGAASHVPGKIRPSPINSPISGTRSRCPRLAGDQTPP